MRQGRRLRDLFLQLATAAAPLATAAVGGCDTYDVYDAEVTIQSWIDADQQQTLCGDQPADACGAICDHLLTRFEATQSGPCIGECRATYCEPHTAETVTVTCECSYIAGRRPAGLRAPQTTWGAGVGAWLAQVAHLEAAAVIAFDRLADELDALQAPPALIRAARRAADDERRHAAEVAALAVARGGLLHPPEVPPQPPRPLAALALENAAEGCVLEAFAALLATLQAQQADDPEVRAVFARIAEDETRHGEMAWALHRWLLPRLSANARRQVRRTAQRAAASLTPDALPSSLRSPLGLPNPAQHRLLAARFAAEVLA